jgi:uncharacterized protein
MDGNQYTQQNSPQFSSPLPAMTPSDERTWAMLAHLSTLINLVSGILGPVAALVIYLSYKDSSRYVAYQALQSFILQLIGWIGGGILVGITWTVTGILSAFIIGFCLVPFAILISCIPLGAVVYSIVAAIQCNNGIDFKIWLIGDWVRGTYTG